MKNLTFEQFNNAEFKLFEGNPVIKGYPSDGGPDFRDPAIAFIDGKYYCVMATGNKETQTARLLLYVSEDLFEWKYLGIMSEWADCIYAECPSFMKTADGFLLAASVCPIKSKHYFSLMFGRFENEKFIPEHIAEVDKGPDQYAGQVFSDHKGRNILISWVPGWRYKGFASSDVGCMSVPREIGISNGKITAYPIEELWHLLKDSDDALVRTENGFVVEREGREPVVYNGKINDLKMIRDGYLLEVFVNGGEEVFTVLL